MSDLTDAECDALGRRAENAVRQTISNLAESIKPITDVAALATIGLGALVAAGDLLCLIQNQASTGSMETLAIAHLRGALRGLNVPIDADGRELEEPSSHG